MAYLKLFKTILAGVGFLTLVISGTYLTTKYGAHISDVQRKSSHGDNGTNGSSILKKDAKIPSQPKGTNHSNPLPSVSKMEAVLVNNNGTNGKDIKHSGNDTFTNSSTWYNTMTPNATMQVVNATYTETSTSPSTVDSGTGTATSTQSGAAFQNNSTITSPPLSSNASPSFAYPNATATKSDLSPTAHPTTTGGVAVTTIVSYVNGTFTSNETLQQEDSGTKGLTPTLAAIVGIGCVLVFIVTVFALFKLFKNFKSFRFSRLHEMPMDDFDDYSGVYVEHTVPFRG